MATLEQASTPDLADLEQQLRGTYIGRYALHYDEARKLYNGMIDKRPAAIVQCADVADVVVALRYAREQGLQVAVRSGGHNGAGLGSVDDGLVIDLSTMKGVPRFLRVWLWGSRSRARSAPWLICCTRRSCMTWAWPRLCAGTWKGSPSAPELK